MLDNFGHVDIKVIDNYFYAMLQSGVVTYSQWKTAMYCLESHLLWESNNWWRAQAREKEIFPKDFRFMVHK